MVLFSSFLQPHSFFFSKKNEFLDSLCVQGGTYFLIRSDKIIFARSRLCKSRIDKYSNEQKVLSDFSARYGDKLDNILLIVTFVNFADQQLEGGNCKQKLSFQFFFHFKLCKIVSFIVMYNFIQNPSCWSNQFLQNANRINM